MPALHIQAALLGILEGLTEFLPVSSTGHLILADRLINLTDNSSTVFDVTIQLGAILAVCVVYFNRLWSVLLALPHDPAARRFTAAIAIAFLPAAVLGAMLHGIIKAVLFDPYVVCVALIVGGVAIIVIERILPPARHHAVEAFSPGLSLRIGLCQCAAMIPGVSRSGATILGSLLMGVDRKTAAEFSFFLAIPTMAGATAFDLYKNWSAMTADSAISISIGFVTAFLSALVVVRAFVGFVSRYGFSPFGWYRIILGTVMLGVLAS